MENLISTSLLWFYLFYFQKKGAKNQEVEKEGKETKTTTKPQSQTSWVKESEN